MLAFRAHCDPPNHVSVVLVLFIFRPRWNQRQTTMTTPHLSAADWTTLPPPRAPVDRYVATSTYSPLRQSPNPNPPDDVNSEEDESQNQLPLTQDPAILRPLQIAPPTTERASDGNDGVTTPSHRTFNVSPYRTKSTQMMSKLSKTPSWMFTNLERHAPSR